MHDLTADLALQIAEAVFHVDPGFDKIATIDDPLGDMLFDIGFNAGPQTAGTFVQRAINSLNYPAGALGAALKVDGSLGSFTRTSLTKFIALRGAEGRTVLRGMVLAQHSVRYIALTETAVSQKELEYGWQLNRVIGNSELGNAS